MSAAKSAAPASADASTDAESTGAPVSKMAEVANLAFQLSVSEDYVSAAEKASIKTELLKLLEDENMAPMYEKVCRDLGWPVDQTLVSKMRAKIEEDVKAADAKVTEAKEKFGEVEVFDRYSEKAILLARTGDVEGSLKAYEELFQVVKHVSTGQKVDVAMAKARMFLAASDWAKAKEKIMEAKDLNDKGGDWDRRNRLKVYEGLYHLSQRDFSTASSLLMDSVATFTAHELMSYPSFVFYTVLTALKTLDRVSLKKKVVDSPDVLSSISDVPHLSSLLNSFYECRYTDFMKALVDIYPAIVRDRFLSKHAPFYLREMRLAAYNQFLTSYKSVTLEGMAKVFGVSAAFLDAELSRFIANGRVAAKIDAVAGIIETSRADAKNAQYQQVLKQGDALLNKVQRLSRVVAL